MNMFMGYKLLNNIPKAIEYLKLSIIIAYMEQNITYFTKLTGIMINFNGKELIDHKDERYIEI
jgi:hypothetical protein